MHSLPSLFPCLGHGPSLQVVGENVLNMVHTTIILSSDQSPHQTGLTQLWAPHCEGSPWAPSTEPAHSHLRY